MTMNINMKSRLQLILWKLLAPLVVMMGVICAQPAYAQASDIYTFDSPTQQIRFNLLSEQFRCLVCQNESLAESNAPLAKDLRFQIYQMVKQDKSNQEIENFLVDRYGDFVTFRPPVDKLTYLLWFGPLLLLLLGLARLAWVIRRRRKSRTNFYSKEDQQRIKHLLSQY